MDKYRVRLNNGRILGPFTVEQLNELTKKGHISGNEDAQVFPIGEWKPIVEFGFYQKKPRGQESLKTGDDGTFVFDLTKLKKKNVELELDDLVSTQEEEAPQIHEEPKTTILNEKLNITKEKIEETNEEKLRFLLENKKEESSFNNVRETENENPASKNREIEFDFEKSLPKLELEKIQIDEVDVDELISTKLNTKDEKKVEIEIKEEIKPVIIEEEINSNETDDRTRVNPKAQLELKKLKEKLEREERQKTEEEKKQKEEQLKRDQEKEEQKKQVVTSDDSTQVLSLEAIKNEIIKEADSEEKEIEIVEEKYKKRKKEQEDKEREDDPYADEEDDDEGENPAKRIIIIVLACVLLYAILFPDEKKEKAVFKLLTPEIIFPIPFDVSDNKISEDNFNKGKELFLLGNYVELVKAAKYFKLSYEHNLDNLQALNLLVRTYAEILKYSKQKLVDAQVVFNLIQSKRTFLLQDPNGAIGLNLFYTSISKHNAAVDFTSKYLKLNPKNIIQDLFAVYLQSLLKVGKLELAKQIFTALEKAPDKNQYSYEALMDYLSLNQESEKVDKYLAEALKKYPQNLNFLLKKSERLIGEKKFAESKVYLEKVESLGLGYNDLVRAKFLELTGFLLAAQGKVKEATVFLESSLKIEDSAELRKKLSELNDTNGAFEKTDQLISQSKAIKLLNQAIDFYDKNNFELALSYVAKAADASEGHIPSELFLAKVQMKLGLAEHSIKTLEALLKKNPENKDVNFAMIEAYIDSYKFHDAKTLMATISTMDIKNSWEYASLNAKMNKKMGNSLQAIAWLKSSINLNPLNDQDIYNLAEIFLKRNNFDTAQSLLSKCIELDPTNPDYRITYARIIYEKQDDQSAIGYLLTLLNEFGENPRILGEIAVLYFRAGKVKDFESFKERISKLPQKDKYLYEYLIRTALLEERYDEIPKLVEELIKIEPGDLESMMTAGRVLFENGKLKEAAAWFKRVQEKLTTYPKVQYYGAKIKLLAGEIDDPVADGGVPFKDQAGNPVLGALNLIKKDIKENGENDVSLVLLGEIYVAKDMLVEAETTFKKAQKINPKSYEALIGMADISAKRSNFDLALDLYQKAMTIKSDEAVLHKKVGDVYRLIGQGALAIESYKMYLEMEPDAPDKTQIESYINIMQ